MFTANLACLFTLANLCCGFFAIVLHLMGNNEAALCALLAAFFCDGLDGYVARKINICTPFGERLDSQADLVSFGMAPAFIAVNARGDWEVPLLAAAALYVVCGAVRLARYDPREQKNMFKGMPIPICGLLLVSSSISAYFNPWFYLVPAMLGLLMISDIPFLKNKFHGNQKFLSLGMGAIGTLTFLLDHDVAHAVLAFSMSYLALNLGLALRDVTGRLRAGHERALAKRSTL